MLKHKTLAIIALTLTAVTAQAAPPPAIEMGSLLDGVRVRFKGIRAGQGGRLEFGYKGPAEGVFIKDGDRVQVALFPKGQTDPLVSYPVPVGSASGIWRQVAPRTSGQEFTFTKAGEYTLTYFVNGKPATSIDLKVRFLKSDDAFDPSVYTIVDGPWNNLACLHVYEGELQQPVRFDIWTRKITTKPSEHDKMSIQLFRGDELVAVTNDKNIAWPEWLRHQASFTFPPAQGGRVFRFSDLLKVDGKYTITVKVNGTLYGHYNFEVADGSIKPHQRQVMGYKPSDRWLVPKALSVGLDGAGSVYWLDRTQTASGEASEQVARPSRADRKKWQIIPDADPERPFQVVHTSIPTRKDTNIAAGDGIVAFATGRTTGVAFLRVGEDKAQSIPNGQLYRSDLFHVCGKKIVLTNQYNLFVYDTASDRTHAIPANEIHLQYQKASLYGPRYTDSDGYLVVTVNDPTKVKDREVIKVLDLSSAEPRIISIRNTGFTASDVDSVKVSAKHGYVAVGSSRQQAIFVAPIADGAKLKKYDLSGYDSFGESDMALLDRHVVYRDKQGFAHLRVLDLETGEVITPAMSQHGGSWSTTVATNGRIVTWPTKDPRATFVVSEDLENAKPLANSNGPVSDEAGYGKLGVGNSAVVAHDGTIFLAGSDSISSQRCLQMGIDGRWHVIPGPDGMPLPAIDVVLGEAMIAFKTGKPSTSSITTVSYATYGERIEAPRSKHVAAARATPTRTKPAPTKRTADDNPHFTRDDQDKAFLAEVLKNEKVIYDALKQALGDTAAKKRAIDAAISALTNAEKKHLIDEYKRRSSLVPEDEKPKATRRRSS